MENEQDTNNAAGGRSRSTDLLALGGLEKEVVCKGCGKTFVAKKRSDGWPKYCCFSCYKKPNPPQVKECPTCGCAFETNKKKYCSHKCYAVSAKVREQLSCAQCGALFDATPFNANRKRTMNNGEAVFCSVRCHNDYHTGDKHPQWKGGKFIRHGRGSPEVRVLIQTPGNSGKYSSEHRVIAARAIGRALDRQEIVLHINRDRCDNRPDNLFICGSFSEAMRRMHGSLQFPTSSNLGTYERANA